MCLEIPGKIIEIKGDQAIVDYGSEKKIGKIIKGTFEVGDFVLIKNKIIIEKIDEKQVRGWLEFLKENDETGD